MKKIIVLMIMVVATMSFVFPQGSLSSQILKDWRKDRAKISQINEDPEVKEKMLIQLDSIYCNIYTLTLDNENSQEVNVTSSNSKKNPTGATQPKTKIFGGNFSLPGFEGSSYNVTKAADAYATAVVADSYAYSEKKMIDNYYSNNATTTKESEKEDNVLVVNESYYAVTFIITRVGSSTFKKTIAVAAKEGFETYLPVGRYEIRTLLHIAGYTISEPTLKQVGNPMSSGSYNGKTYEFVAIFPNF